MKKAKEIEQWIKVETEKLKRQVEEKRKLKDAWRNSFEKRTK